MLWVLLTMAGLAVETLLIVALGRGVTGPYEQTLETETALVHRR